MSKSFLKLLISQLFANLADIFLRVSLIAISTSLQNPLLQLQWFPF